MSRRAGRVRELLAPAVSGAGAPTVVRGDKERRGAGEAEGGAPAWERSRRSHVPSPDSNKRDSTSLVATLSIGWGSPGRPRPALRADAVVPIGFEDRGYAADLPAL
jgi:hypothetical protein